MSEGADERDEFYVGYLADAPPGLASWVRARVVAVLGLAALLAALLASSQAPFSKAVFEFGATRTFEGTVRLEPYPLLVVERPGRVAAGAPAVSGNSRYLLTVFGKSGAEEALRGLDGKRVRLEGSLVYRDDRTMIELSGSAPEVLGEGALTSRPEEGGEDLGLRTFRGEIVDSKCFLGVMKPGNLKPHRACATRCISGGVPPVLLVRDGEGRAHYLLLASAAGRAVNAEVLDRVAEPLEIEGRLLRYGDLFILRADPASYRRLDY